MEQLLGTDTDTAIAKSLKCSEQGVRNRRRKLRLPSFNSVGRYWSQKEDSLLGNLPDATIAEELQRTLKTVQSRRHKLGIPAPSWKPPR